MSETKDFILILFKVVFTFHYFSVKGAKLVEKFDQKPCLIFSFSITLEERSRECLLHKPPFFIAIPTFPVKG